MSIVRLYSVQADYIVAICIRAGMGRWESSLAGNRKIRPFTKAFRWDILQIGYGEWSISCPWRGSCSVHLLRLIDQSLLRSGSRGSQKSPYTRETRLIYIRTLLNFNISLYYYYSIVYRPYIAIYPKRSSIPLSAIKLFTIALLIASPTVKSLILFVFYLL